MSPSRTRADDPGEVALVLHTHMPYVKGHGVWPVGEEWLFQVWGESWLAVTDLLLRLADEGATDVLTLGVTPLVAHQVADVRLRAEMGTWLAGQMWRSEEQRTLHPLLPRQVTELGPFHWRRYARLLAVHERIEATGGLPAVWADLAAAGVIELLGGPATHPYLPLQADQRLVDAQLACGLDHHASWAGTRPTGLWAPEMGYRPAGRVADATAEPDRVDNDGSPVLSRAGPELAGLETAYAAAGIDHFLVDEATVRARGTDDAVGDGVLVGASDVVAYARDLTVDHHVWSPQAGYPGDAWYRDYHARGGFGLHPSWRVTDRTSGADDKAPYVPDRARARVETDADHLHGVLRGILDPAGGRLVVAAFDTELFGHWWFEGVDWLEGLLRRIGDDPRLRTTTLASRLSRRPPTRRLHLPESSWGVARSHVDWVADDTRWMWQALRDAEQRARAALTTGRGTTADREQLCREVALLAASDWPFLVIRDTARDYAEQRVRGHAAAVEALAGAVANGRDGGRAAARLRAIDTTPADVDPLIAALSG